MVNPKQKFMGSEEGFLDQADTLLKKKVLLNILNEDDASCIKSFVSEIAATRNISSARRYKLTSTLANSRKWLKSPFRQMTTPDLFMGIDALQNDPSLDEDSVADFVRYLKEISIWLVENEMASPGLKIEKIGKINPPISSDRDGDDFETDLNDDTRSQVNKKKTDFSDNIGRHLEINNLVTLAKIFLKNKKYDLAKAIAEYCMDDPPIQKTCLEILMRCTYFQKDFLKSLEYIEKLVDIDPLNSIYATNKNQIIDKINEMHRKR